MVKIERAVISVSDKDGIVDFCKGLSQLGVELISTGGTAKLLSSHGLKVVGYPNTRLPGDDGRPR